jgi:hypothetical protein
LKGGRRTIGGADGVTGGFGDGDAESGVRKGIRSEVDFVSNAWAICQRGPAAVAFVDAAVGRL